MVISISISFCQHILLTLYKNSSLPSFSTLQCKAAAASKIRSIQGLVLGGIPPLRESLYPTEEVLPLPEKARPCWGGRATAERPCKRLQRHDCPAATFTGVAEPRPVLTGLSRYSPRRSSSPHQPHAVLTDLSRPRRPQLVTADLAQSDMPWIF